MNKKLSLLLFFIFINTSLFAQESNPFDGDVLFEEDLVQPIKRLDVDSIKAMELFNWGVRAFHEGLYNKALLDFEQAVRLKPSEPLYRLWLGYANFATGLDDLAIRQWQGLVNDDQIGGGWLRTRIETLQFRTSPSRENIDQDPWTVRHQTDGRSNQTIRFDSPTDLTSDPLGTLTYVAGYTSNNIAVFDVNGNLRTRFSGGVMPLSGPWGVLAMSDGNLFVSEFRGQRITLLNPNGRRLLTFGSTAEEGALLGPQYMTSTEDGYLYVSDWVGNKVVKYDFNGKYIMTVGLPNEQFKGLRQPTGIAATAQELFIVDSKDRLIHVFDHSGNYLRTFGQGLLERPEQIRIEHNRLLIADGKRVISYDLSTGDVITATDLNGRAQRIVSVDIDRNGTIVVADQINNNLSFLIPRSELYGNFFVNVHRINNDAFPTTRVIASIQSRSGSPMLGLDKNNFFIEENGLPLTPLTVSTLDTRRDGSLASVIMVEGSKLTENYRENLLHAIQELSNNFTPNDEFSLIWASEQPIHLTNQNSQEIVGHFHRLFPQSLSSAWNFERGLRLAGSQLINRNARLAIFFITTGEHERTVAQYAYRDLSSYLKNNNIAFYPIYLKQGSSNQFYDAIAQESGGKPFYLFRPRGLKEVVDIARSRATGLYQIEYRSPLFHNHGRDYINLSIMANVQSQSGLTKSGYFPPIILSETR
ncbi:hypothetical protein [Entomospira culicis]|nr:hypothetical protein [Entomospira culicis]WDI37697.1 hypothetical protein PVA46_02635 [Entomospira culicis]